MVDLILHIVKSAYAFWTFWWYESQMSIVPLLSKLVTRYLEDLL